MMKKSKVLTAACLSVVEYRRGNTAADKLFKKFVGLVLDLSSLHSRWQRVVWTLRKTIVWTKCRLITWWEKHIIRGLFEHHEKHQCKQKLVWTLKKTSMNNSSLNLGDTTTNSCLNTVQNSYVSECFLITGINKHVNKGLLEQWKLQQCEYGKTREDEQRIIWNEAK